MDDLWREWADLLERVGATRAHRSEWFAALCATVDMTPRSDLPDAVGYMLQHPRETPGEAADEVALHGEEVLAHVVGSAAALHEGSPFARQRVDSLRAAVVRWERWLAEFDAETQRMAGA